MDILPFKQFINEDFNSGDQFTIDVYSRVKKQTNKVTIFFEKVPFPKKENEFNLIRYFKSFKSTAKELMGSKNDELAGIIFADGKDMLIFAFYDAEHEDVCSALDNNSLKGERYPVKKYLQTYNNMYLEFDIPKNWCFSFVFEHDRVISNLPLLMLRPFNAKYGRLLGLV